MNTILLILILVIGYSAAQIIGEIVQSRKCPDDKLLKDVVSGRANKNTREARNVTTHLGVCSSCRDKIDKFINNEF